MPLMSPAQLQAIKADILANTNTVPSGQPWSNGFDGQQIKDLPNSSGASATIAGWYNQTAAPSFVVWRDMPMETVLALINYANMTPADAVPTDTDLNIQIWKARSLACQGKQFNLQNLTLGRSTAPMKKSNYRAAMQDALTNIPAGASGALISAGWVNVRDAAKFNATYFEKLFAVGTGTTNSPADLVLEGLVTADQVQQARELP